MRAFLVAIVSAVAMTTAAGQQEPANDKPPKKGDRVVVRGCLRGAILEAADTTVVDGTAKYPTPISFRLSGDKKLLKEMRKHDDGRVVEVTGVLKSDLPSDAPGKRIGNTRIVVGMGTQQSMQQAPPHMPVLDVKSYEGVAPCGG